MAPHAVAEAMINVTGVFTHFSIIMQELKK
jgi:hypothetical protein